MNSHTLTVRSRWMFSMIITGPSSAASKVTGRAKAGTPTAHARIVASKSTFACDLQSSRVCNERLVSRMNHWSRGEYDETHREALSCANRRTNQSDEIRKL